MSDQCRHSMCAAPGALAALVHFPVQCLCQTTVWSISSWHSMLSCLASIHTLRMLAAQHLLRHLQLQLPLLCLIPPSSEIARDKLVKMVSNDLTDVTLVSDDTKRGLDWRDLKDNFHQKTTSITGQLSSKDKFHQKTTFVCFDRQLSSSLTRVISVKSLEGILSNQSHISQVSKKPPQ